MLKTIGIVNIRHLTITRKVLEVGTRRDWEQSMGWAIGADFKLRSECAALFPFSHHLSQGVRIIYFI